MNRLALITATLVLAALLSGAGVHACRFLPSEAWASVDLGAPLFDSRAPRFLRRAAIKGWERPSNMLGIPATASSPGDDVASDTADTADGHATPSDDLAAASIAKAIDRSFPGQQVSYVLLDARTGSVTASRWPNLDRPVAVGSLFKPFAALAYFESHSGYPAYDCEGSASGCWYARGHKHVGISRAVAVSCNAYFRALAVELSREGVATIAQRFGLDPPSSSATRDSLLGLGDGWKVSPVALLRAYVELGARRMQPGVSQLIDGMETAPRSGTARAASPAGERLLAKTGTAPCSHERKAPGDGFAMLLSDRDAPRFALLVRLHGRPGAEAAAIAGRMLRTALGRTAEETGP